MDAREYAGKLAVVLAPFSAEAAGRLQQFQAAALEAGNGVTAILVDVFVDQDGEGPFEVWVRFEGSASFSLDRRFEEDRHLFGVEWGEEGWEPDVPARPRGWTRDDLLRAALDAVSDWVAPLLPQGAPDGFWQIGTPDW